MNVATKVRGFVLANVVVLAFAACSDDGDSPGPGDAAGADVQDAARAADAGTDASGSSDDVRADTVVPDTLSDIGGEDAEVELCEYSITEHVQPLFQNNCSNNGACHATPTNQSGLNLEGPDYAGLFNRPAQGDPDTLLTSPGNPDDSLIYLKVQDLQRVGRRMPLGGQLADDQITLIGAWISGGVVNETFRAPCALEL